MAYSKVVNEAQALALLATGILVDAEPQAPVQSTAMQKHHSTLSLMERGSGTPNGIGHFFQWLLALGYLPTALEGGNLFGTHRYTPSGASTPARNFQARDSSLSLQLALSHR